MNHSIVASSQMGWRKRERESEWAKDREIRRVWVKVRCWHGQPRNQLAFPAVILPLALTPSLPLPRATLHGYLSFPFSQGHSSHFIVFHFKCVHLIMRLVSAANTKKKRMKSEKSRERKAQKITAATAASQKYIPYLFLAFFWLPRTLPKANSCPAGNVCAAGGEEGRRGRLWGSCYRAARLLWVLGEVLGKCNCAVCATCCTRESEAACDMPHVAWAEVDSRGCSVSQIYENARDAPQSSPCARIGFDDFTNSLQVMGWDKAKSIQINTQVFNENRDFWIKKSGILNQSIHSHMQDIS